MMKPRQSICALAFSTLLALSSTVLGNVEGPGTATILYDGYDGNISKLSEISFQDFFKAAFGVRFTPAANHLPFTVTTVTALLTAPPTGPGFHPGDPIEIVILVDADGTGNLARATVVDREATTVNETGSYVLANPVTVNQGDLYAFVVDRSTTNDGTFVVYESTRKGAVNAHRSFIGSATAMGHSGIVGQHANGPGAAVAVPNDIETFDDFAVDSRISDGNFVIRIQGTTADSVDATGGGEPTDASLAIPAVTGYSIGPDLRISLPPIAAPTPPAPSPVDEVEPNNSIARAQPIPANARVSGSAQSSDPGDSGGACVPAQGFCDDIEDYYTFTTTVPMRLTATLSDFGLANDFDLVLYSEGANTSDAQLTAVAFAGANPGQIERISVEVLAPGTYYLGVTAFDPGVPLLNSYKLLVATAPAVTGYNVYCGDGPVTPSASFFVGTAGPGATAFTVRNVMAGAACVVTAVVGGRQSAASAPVTAAPCAGGPSIDGAKLKAKKLTLTNDARGFGGITAANTQVLLDGVEIENPVFKVTKQGAGLSIKGTVNGGQPLTAIGAPGSSVEITIIAPGGCAQGSVTVP